MRAAAVRACVQAQFAVAWLRLADLLLVPTVDGDGVATLAEHGCLAAAGLQSDASWRVVVKRARLLCLRFYGCCGLCAQVCSAMQRS